MYVTGTASTAATGYEGKQDSQSLGSLDNFLKLFLSQIQYQDPLNPVQDHEFIAQLAQFSQLEATQATNNHLSTVGRLLESSLSYQGLQLLGREVHVETDDGSFSGLVEGVTYREGRPALLINGRVVELGQVVQVNIAAPTGGGEQGE